jgi:hypothetical protein
MSGCITREKDEFDVITSKGYGPYRSTVIRKEYSRTPSKDTCLIFFTPQQQNNRFGAIHNAV